jgi:HK97 family phage major capsid protein
MSHALARAVRQEAGAANAIVQAAERQGRLATNDELAKIKGHLGKAQQFKNQLDRQRGLTNQAASITSIGAPAGDGLSGTPAPVFYDQQPAAGTGSSPGRQFTSSAEYKGLRSSMGSPDQPWGNRRVVTNPVSATALRPRNALLTGSSEELLGTSTDGAGLTVRPEFRGFLATTYGRELKLLDLLLTVPTETDAIDYVKVASVTNAAAAVAEATSSAAPTAPAEGGALIPAVGGGYKPESAMTFAEQQDYVRTIAHVLPVTKKALADARQLEMIINAFMRYGLEEKLEDLILTGDGTGQNYLGILHASRQQSAPGVLDGVQVVAPGTDSELDIARKLKTRAALGRGGAPNGYLMHPLTVERFELLKDLEDRYYIGGPFAGSTEDQLTLWRLPVVSSEAIAESVVLCGNFRQAVYFDRQQATITASESHLDFYTRNLVMILAELRAGFGVLNESAFAKSTLV